MKKILMGTLIAAFFCFAFVGCGGPKECGGTDGGTPEGYEVTFECDENVAVCVYETQDMTGTGTPATVAYSRDKETSKPTKTDGQVNFVLVFEDGYELKNIAVTEGYKNIKGYEDTGVENGYRITKITADLTVTVTSQEISGENPTDDPSAGEDAGGNENTGNTGDGTDKNTDDENKKEGETAATYNEYEKAENLGVKITCEGGAENCFTVDEKKGVITFGAISEASVYSVSGKLSGQIVINVGDDYDFELSMKGFTVTSDCNCPVLISSAGEATLSAKNGTENYVYDTRASVLDDDSAYNSAIYSAVDLNLQGKGSLTVISENNKGVHTKDDLSVKNLSLYVKCADNALKGNDSVTISAGTVTLIATGGDCIKTATTTVSSKNKQKGTVTVSGGTVTLYAACDGIDAAYDAVISGDAVLNIYTGRYSEYTGERVSKSKTTAYLCMSSSYYSASYRYAFYFYNSSDDYTWSDASYYKSETSGSGFGQAKKYYYTADMPSGYTNFKLYRFVSSQTENSTGTYNAATTGATLNAEKDTFTISSISTNSKKISGSWSSYSSSSSYSAKGIKANNEIVVSGGTVNVSAEDDAIHCDYGAVLETGEKGAGIVTVSGGAVTILTLDDAIHSDNELIISGGAITVTSSYEGLEGDIIEISGGTIKIYATDDGINAAGKNTNNPYIIVSGGNIDVTVGSGDCDGIDSNGNYTQTGGFVISRDPTTQGGGVASGLDIDGTCTITGGTFICAGAIAETPSDTSSSVCWVQFGSTESMGGGAGGFGGSGSSGGSSVTFSAGTYTVKDSGGNALFAFTLDISYKNMWIASESFSKNGSYTVTNGATSKTWSQSGTSVKVTG